MESDSDATVLAPLSGAATHPPGRGWWGDSERHAEAGRLGGAKVARDRQHMAALGRKGGATISKDRAWMAELGRRGGRAKARKSKETE